MGKGFEGEMQETEGEATAKRALRPAQCRAYLRKELAREFRGIVQGFLDEAKKGSCQHIKLATELVGQPERVRRRRGKGPVRELIERFQAEQARQLDRTAD